jgi:hypothetical protein
MISSAAVQYSTVQYNAMQYSVFADRQASNYAPGEGVFVVVYIILCIVVGKVRDGGATKKICYCCYMVEMPIRYRIRIIVYTKSLLKLHTTTKEDSK